MSKRRKSNPRLRRAWNKRPKYMPSFTNMKTYTNMHVTTGVDAEELARGEPVIFHDSLLMLKRLGGFHQGIDKWHEVRMPWLHSSDKMYFTGSMYVFFRELNGLVTRTCIFNSKEKAVESYRKNRLHWFIPYKEEEEDVGVMFDESSLKPIK